MSGLRSGGSEPSDERMFGWRASSRHRVPRGWALIGGCLSLLLACALAFECAPASAATGHPFLSSLTEASAGTSLVEPQAIAVDHTTGDVFVADPGAGMVDVYSPSGAFVTQFGEGGLSSAGIAVDEASGLVYVADAFDDEVLVFKPDGTSGYRLLEEWHGEALPGKEFGEVTGVAVDNSASASAGDVYVVDGESPETDLGAVDVLKPAPAGAEEGAEGDLVRVLTNGKMEAPNGVAVSGASGRVFVADSVKGAVYDFGAGGAYEGAMTGKGSPYGSFRGSEEEEGNVAAVAVDQASGDIYVAEAGRHVVSQFAPGGEWLGWITKTPSGPFSEPLGVGIGPSGGAYVADGGRGVVDVFGPGVVVPDVTTGKVSKLSRTGAALGGTVDGDGKPASYRFEWGTTEALGSSTPASAAGAGEEKVVADLSELHADTAYFFRLTAENENGANYGVEREFTTPPAVEALTTGPVQDVMPTSATLTGSLTPGGFDTHYYFEWGRSTAYGETTPAPPGIDAGAGSTPISAKAELSGLAANTVYHYRLIGENSLGRTLGEDQTFTTSGPPRITNEPTSGIGHETATINAKVDPDEIATSYRFEYGQSTAYGTEVPLGGASVGSGSEPVAVAASLTGLKIGTVYHFRVVATNSSAETTRGPDQTFETTPSAPVDAEYVTEVTANEATLHTAINPLGSETTFYFQYGTESCAEDPSACTDIPLAPGEEIGSGEEDVARSVRLSGLKPQSIYHYRVVASNALGTTEGAERSFTTEQAPSPLALADGRAWEMVSPPDKQGAPVEALTREGGLIVASEDGDGLTYVVDGALGEEAQGSRSPEWQQILATRGASQWSSQDIATPTDKAQGITGGQTPEYQFFTPDLSGALVEPVGPGAEPPLAPGVTQATMYVRDDLSGTYLPLLSEADVAPDVVFGGEVHFLSATPDLSHVVLASKVALTGPLSAPGLYEWAAGALQLVSVLPSGAAAPGLVELGYSHNAANAISGDGSRIIWTTPEEEAKLGHLYMRDTATGETVELDAAQGIAEPSGRGSARFQTASVTARACSSPTSSA